METDRLIDLLAHDAGPAPRAVVARRIGPAAAGGLAAAAALALAWLGPLPAALWTEPALWLKLGYAALLGSLALAWLARCARPAAPTRGAERALVGVALAMASLALVATASLPAAQRAEAIWGHSWWECPAFVLGCALPALALTLRALRGLAPTDLPRAGAAAGLVAGCAGALGYGLVCDELGLAFIALWYTLGIVLCAALGAWLGPRVLRW